MSEVIEKLTEGDVFRWSYREPGDDRQWGRYHCCSGIAVVHGGLLRDTYWQIGSSFSEGRRFGIDDLQKINLTRLANMADLERVPEYQSDYYDDADIVDLNHANSTRGNFYLRKGAKRSRDKMEAIARKRFAEAESDFHTARSRMDEIGKIIDQLQAGESVSHIPSWR